MLTNSPCGKCKTGVHWLKNVRPFPGENKCGNCRRPLVENIDTPISHEDRTLRNYDTGHWSGVFVFSDLDKFDPRFMSLDIGKNPDTNELLKWDTKIELLRAKKEADDK